MSARITSVEDHKSGEFHVDVNLNGIRNRFPSMMDATKWLNLMKRTSDEIWIFVDLREIIITAKRQLVYESSYVY